MVCFVCFEPSDPFQRTVQGRAATMASSYTYLYRVHIGCTMYIGCKAKRQRVQWDGGANAPDWLRAWVHHSFRRTQLLPSREETTSSLGTAVQHNFRRTLLVPSREENISSLDAAVQQNFRRTLLVPSREESISSLGTAVQHNFRRTLLLPYREESISNLGSVVQHNFRRTQLLPSSL